MADTYADQPIVLISDSSADPARLNRFWAAHGGGAVYTPLVIVDSGHQYTSGGPGVDYIATYTPMIDAALERAPKAFIKVNSSTLAGDTLTISFDLTNKSGTALYFLNNWATVVALVYEENTSIQSGEISSRTVRAVEEAVIITSLLNNETQTFTLAITIADADWSKMRPLVFADYQPAGGAFDMLQAARAPISN